MNNEQELQNIALQQLSLGSVTKYESTRNDTSINMTPASLPLTLSKWQPMGIRVVMDLPFTSTPNSPLFAIRVAPSWYAPMEWAGIMQTTNVASTTSMLNNLPVFVPVPFGTGNTIDVPESTTDTPVRVSYYGEPPPLCRYTRVHKYNSGSLKYQLVVTSGNITHGYFQTTLVRGIRWPTSLVKHVYQKVPLEVQTSEFNSVYDNFVNSKPANEGYINIECPRSCATGVFDRIHDLVGLHGLPHPGGYDYIIVHSKGTLSSLANTQLVFELNIAAGEDFKLYMPLPISVDLRNFWSAEETKLTGNQYAIAMATPGLTFPSALKVYRDLFDESTGELKPASSLHKWQPSEIVGQMYIESRPQVAKPATKQVKKQ